MSKKSTAKKKSGRPALKEQSIQVELSDKKVKIVRRTNKVVEVINRGKALTYGKKKFSCNAKIDGQAKAILKQVVSEKNLDIDVDKQNTQMLGKNVIAALLGNEG
jgi:hypothetical protein